MYNKPSEGARLSRMNNEKTVIYHNPRCSKSRETLQIIEDNQVDAEVVRYLDEPPDAEELQRIISLLGIPARELAAHYGEAGLRRTADLDDDSLGDDDIIRGHLRQYPIAAAAADRGARRACGHRPAAGQGTGNHCIRYWSSSTAVTAAWRAWPRKSVSAWTPIADCEAVARCLPQVSAVRLSKPRTRVPASGLPYAQT